MVPGSMKKKKKEKERRAGGGFLSFHVLKLRIFSSYITYSLSFDAKVFEFFLQRGENPSGSHTQGLQRPQTCSLGLSHMNIGLFQGIRRRDIACLDYAGFNDHGAMADLDNGGGFGHFALRTVRFINTSHSMGSVEENFSTFRTSGK